MEGSGRLVRRGSLVGWYEIRRFHCIKFKAEGEWKGLLHGHHEHIELSP